ncbi:beta-3-deoxy-D-manno-oct-2-ulosonic acid transferase [Candidatus Aalborgicola defluviihabitans]|uniref:capsular polysaccharide export protein, LipB/KpsS family n=1 Tax=Candidatus Aalborgicola defluviihabitans TaxID=3386187 RepID=UPI0039B89875
MVRFPDMVMDVVVYAFPRWKWSVVRQCFPKANVTFVKPGAVIPDGVWLLLWGKSNLPQGLASDIRVLRMEDGFLRSVGLGAELVRPLSWVIDGRGMYYDATTPSDLECILATHPFDEALCARAAELRECIVASRLTKYNVGGGFWTRPSHATRVILVPGQVESDASLAYGAPGERSNMGLLRTVRAMHPRAYIVYKPHPDVVARLRKQGVCEQDAIAWCDEVLKDVSMGDLLLLVDEVHVLTSLTGFEALLQGKRVVCHGQPFYSGWGLTHDCVPNPRRQRRLSLDALVAGVLIEYPLYMSRDGKVLISAEQALDTLVQWRQRRGMKVHWWQRITRTILRIFIGVR